MIKDAIGAESFWLPGKGNISEKKKVFFLTNWEELNKDRG